MCGNNFGNNNKSFDSLVALKCNIDTHTQSHKCMKISESHNSETFKYTVIYAV